MGTCSCEPCLGTCFWKPCLEICSWKPYLGTCSWKFLGTLLAKLFLGNLAWKPCLGTLLENLFLGARFPGNRILGTWELGTCSLKPGNLFPGTWEPGTLQNPAREPGNRQILVAPTCSGPFTMAEDPKLSAVEENELKRVAGHKSLHNFQPLTSSQLRSFFLPQPPQSQPVHATAASFSCSPPAR